MGIGGCGDTHIHCCGLKTQHRGGSLAQGSKHLAFKPAGNKGIGRGKQKPPGVHLCLQGCNPDLENAGMQHFLEIFRNF